MKHGWTQVYKIEKDCIWLILKKVGQTFFRFIANRLNKGRFAHNHLVCHVTIFLSVKEFDISIFEF